MARRGFLSRVTQALSRALPRLPGRAPPSPPREPSPREPPPREPPPSRNDYREAWRDSRGKGSYQRNLRLFHQMVDPIESDPEEQLELWKSYLKHINTGHERRNSTSNMFWRDTGIDPQDFNWAAWRQAMGYTGKRRSRTP